MRGDVYGSETNVTFSKPAVLGGAPAFASKITMVRPVLPGFDAVAPRVRDCLDTGMVTKGRYLNEFEDAIAHHLGVKHAVCVSSCTTGLMLTYQVLGLTGDVVVPSFTFMATVIAAGLGRPSTRLRGRPRRHGQPRPRRRRGRHHASDHRHRRRAHVRQPRRNRRPSGDRRPAPHRARSSTPPTASARSMKARRSADRERRRCSA